MTQKKRKKTSKSKKRRDNNEQQIFLMSVLPTAGSVVSVATTPETSWRYMECHDHLPPASELVRWSEEQVRALPLTVDSSRPDTWERALILLAHHQSNLAVELIEKLRDRVPASLADFYELALAEAKGWLGSSFIQDEDGMEPLNPMN